MSSDRSNTHGRTLKPTLAASRPPRAPLTPRLATAGTPSPAPGTGSVRRPPTLRSEVPTLSPRPRIQAKQDETPVKDTAGNVNVTPRSSTRKSRVEGGSATPPPAGDSPSLLKGRSTIAGASATADRNGSVGVLAAGSGLQARPRAARPKSIVSDNGMGRTHSPLVRAPGATDLGLPQAQDSIDSRFFHASDARKQEPVQKKIEPKKVAAGFFYADGQKEEKRAGGASSATSPVLSAVSDKRTSGPWAKMDTTLNPLKSPPLLSPGLSSLSSSSPFFPAASQLNKPRSPSPSKENIHLSYRKGASQIFGSRPSPIPSPRTSDNTSATSESRRGSLERKALQTPHRKSPSLSSIDSGNSHQSRRRSATTLDGGAPAPSPLSLEAKSATFPKVPRPPTNIPSIDTSLHAHDIRPAPEIALSPTKNVSDLAAEARRERKVLDLEISNSSLLAINASLEREVRRQKAELKRFRRLSRAGRFSISAHERAARLSEGLSTLGEEDERDEDYTEFGPPSGFTEVYDDFSDDDDETESITSGGEPLSPTAHSSRESERLAKDEKRLRVDLAKHKELLVQSQMMNQTIKRCMYSTEEMIKDGKKALDYHVRVSDVKLGGRILTGHEDDDHSLEADIEVEDDTLHAETMDQQTQGFLDVWQGVGAAADGGRLSLESSEGGDRDSGIEVDKPFHQSSFASRIPHADLDRPPEELEGITTTGVPLQDGFRTIRGRPTIRWGNTIS